MLIKQKSMSYARNHQFWKYFNFNISSILNIVKNFPLKLDLLQRCRNDKVLIFLDTHDPFFGIWKAFVQFISKILLFSLHYPSFNFNFFDRSLVRWLFALDISFSINIVDTLIRSQMFWKISITRSSLNGTIHHVQ